MTPQEFIDKWQASELKERSAAQEHFIDLCRLLEEPTPADIDPKGEFYCFERGAKKEGGGDGWADVWKRHHFGWEYKGKKKDLEKARDQLRQYAVALENPPLLVVCDTSSFVITTNFTNTVQERHELSLEDMLDAEKRALLKAVFSNPEALKPGKTRQALTEDVAAEFAALATRLRERGEDPERVAHFVNRLVFCMFAEDVDLLPNKMFQRMLEHSEHAPETFAEHARTLFAAMKSGGPVGFEHVHWFNGGLFDNNDVIALEKADVKNLLAAAKLDWSEVDPSILGTLFERGLDPDKRSQLGAHYTDRDKIMMILNPVIKEPLEAEWDEVLGKIETELEKANAAKSASARTQARNRAEKLHSNFMEKLANFRVLDPACGSGNFLNLALLTLKDIEHRANLEAESLGLPRGFPRVGPECVLGIEINLYAAELARVSVWIGEIQWMRKNGFSANTNPVLRPLDTIEWADALVVQNAVEEDWAKKEWPKADVIVGNPPFLGGKLLRSYLGDDYVDHLFDTYRGAVKPEADLVAYWIAKGGAAIDAKRVKRVGFVTTNSIRGGANREVVRQALEKVRIFFAWDDEPWVVDGAAVRVSIVGLEPKEGVLKATLDGEDVDEIYSDLTGSRGQIGVDLTNASRLQQNRGIAFQGVKFGGPFEITENQALKLLQFSGNPNGRENTEVVRLWCNGMDITRRPERRWCIDFDPSLNEFEASQYERPFHLARQQWDDENQRRTEAGERPLRGREARTLEGWWVHQRPRMEMRQALAKLHRFIAVPEVAKHRIFKQLDGGILISGSVYAIARDDDTTFGILHSRLHELWSLRMGTSLEDRPRYTPTSTFETFPFPEGLTPDIAAANFADDPRTKKIAEAASRLTKLREKWLNPSDLVRDEPEAISGYPDRILPVDEAAAKELKKRTLTNLYNQMPVWLDHCHKELDRAVAEAYGWPADLSDDEVLARLFKLNQERAGVEN